MYKCAICGKQYKTAAERTMCEVRCQGIALAKAEEPVSEPREAVSEAEEPKASHAEVSAFSKESAEQLKARNIALREKFERQKHILKQVVRLSATISELAEATSEYEDKYDELVMPEFGSDDKSFCVFLEPDSVARVHIYNKQTKHYEGFADFDADLCDGDCSSCRTSACFKAAELASGKGTTLTKSSSDEPRCTGDCSRCEQAKGTREQAGDSDASCASRRLTPDELMFMLIGTMFR